jgi:predicted neuraminidase
MSLTVAYVAGTILFLNATLGAAAVSEFIFETAPFASCHASTIVETGPGELMAAWFGGTRESAADVAIWGARKSGGKWSVPRELVREPGVPTWNPVLFYSRDGTLWLSYKFGPHPTEWTGGLLASKDDGRTWSAPMHLPAGLYGPIKNKPLVLADGTIVAGASVESYHAWSCWVERSRDNGRTWTRHGPIVFPGEPYGIIQPTIVPMRGGLRMFVRSRRIGKICYADSVDGGMSWSEARATELPNPISGIDAVGLRDGRILLVYNHTDKGRSPLNVALSRDGDHWEPVLALETEPGEFSYPAVIQSRNGDVHITYTWKRQRIKHVRIPLSDIHPRQ